MILPLIQGLCATTELSTAFDVKCWPRAWWVVWQFSSVTTYSTWVATNCCR